MTRKISFLAASLVVAPGPLRRSNADFSASVGSCREARH
jgi:hypothetical protein